MQVINHAPNAIRPDLQLHTVATAGESGTAHPRATRVSCRKVAGACDRSRGVRTVPLFVGVGHPREDANRVQVVAVAAKYYCSLFRPMSPTSILQNEYLGTRPGGTETGQNTNYDENDGGEKPYPCNTLDEDRGIIWCTSTKVSC